MTKRIFLSIVILIAVIHSVFGLCDCTPIPDKGNLEVTVSNLTELHAALDQANSRNGNMTIVVNPGTYNLTTNLRFISANMANLTILGSTQNSSDVVIRGMGWNDNSVTHIFNVAADDFTVANMTIGEVFYHPIQVHSNPEDADNFLAQNVRFVDAKEQLLKVSGGGAKFADNGKVLCCEFEFTAGIAYQYYTGGIDAHRSKDWLVANNTFKHIRSPETLLAEHAIHFWKECEGAVIQSNQIINCDRGIGFGLGNDVLSGNFGGVIRNNFVHTSRDVGIGLETSPNTKIYNNTVITENYPRSIEYRFGTTTNVRIANNITNQEISDRSSGSTGTLTTNVRVSDLSIFKDPANYDYHLKASTSGITDSGTSYQEVMDDYDCESRDDNQVDIGADELASVGCTTTACVVIAGSVRVDATFENIGVNYSIQGDDNLNSALTLRYRVQGSTAWRDGAMAMRAHPNIVVDGSRLNMNFHAASAMYLMPNTSYELQLELNDPDGGSLTTIERVRTKAFPEASINSLKYVSPGSSGGSGTEQDPYLGLQTAADNASAGDQFVVAAGDYDAFSITNSGTVSSPITFVSETQNCAVIDANNSTRHAISIGTSSSVTSHVIIDGFTIQNANWGIDAQNTQFVTVRNNIFQDVGWGFYNRKEEGNESDQYITNNIFIGRTGWPGSGIPPERAIDIRGNNNVVSYNTIRDFADGVSIDGPRYKTSYSLDIHNNDIRNAIDDMVEVDGMISNSRVYSNRLYNGRAGVSVAPVYGGPAYIVRNEIFNLENSAFKMNRGSSGMVIVNNTIVSEGNAVSSPNGWQNTVYRNNVMLASRYCFEFYGLVDGSEDDWDFGAYYSSRAGGGGSEWFKWQDVRYGGVSDLASSGLLESNSISITPSNFVNITLPTAFNIEYDPAQKNLSPTSGSPVINSGTRVDNLNDPYVTDGQVDRGALEFGRPEPNYGASFSLRMSEDCSQAVLPLELISFNVIDHDREVLLNWTVANEVNVKHYVVERRHESELDFVAVVELEAISRASSMMAYESRDYINGLSGYYFYRLKMVDNDGVVEYSQVQSVHVSEDQNRNYKVYPNPTLNEVFVAGLKHDEIDLEIKLYDRIGRLVSSTFEISNGSAKVDLRDLKSGIYILKISANKELQHFKLVKE